MRTRIPAALAAICLAASLAASDQCGVFFGKAAGRWATVRGGPGYQDFAPQARFFSTADYGYVPGGDYQLLGKNFGLLRNDELFRRGQLPTSNSPFGPWLSDGSDCVFGLTFDTPPKPEPGQFDQFPGKVPRFDQATIYWGSLVPRPGSWGACVQDVDGKFTKIELDNSKQLFPFTRSVLDFPPTAARTLFVGLKGKDNFVEVAKIALNLHNRKSLDNHLAVWQMDAYHAAYSPTQPGAVLGLQLANFHFGNRGFDVFVEASPEYCMLTNLAPFVELDGKRLRAAPGDYPVQVESEGRDQTLRYTLKIAGVDVAVTARYGVELKDTIKFEFKAGKMPPGARLGFEMAGSPELFDNYLDQGATVIEENPEAKTFDTPAGPLGLNLDGAARIVLDDKARFTLLASGRELSVALSLPIGPDAGIQPGDLNYTWRPSLAQQGEPGIAPFKRSDLELLETIDLGDPDDPHAVYDISNDPLILNWRKTDGKKLPGGFGRLDFINSPEKGQVPLATVLGQKCRALNNLDTTYFRFNLKTRFNPQVPYLIVVEHAFDKLRRGTFHTISLDQDGQTLANDHSLWHSPCPFGGFDTGKGPMPNAFLKESVFAFRPWKHQSGENTMLSLCFTNFINWGTTEVLAPEPKPDGPAIRKVWIYRANHLPALPDYQALVPEGPRRHVVFAVEGSAPWHFSQFPKLYGYDTLFDNHQAFANFVTGKTVDISRPGHPQCWHPGTLESNRWFFELADRNHLFGKMFFSSLLNLGLEGSDQVGCFKAEDTFDGSWQTCVPLSPTPDELALVAKALDKALPVLAPYKSFYSISVAASPQSFFTKRNLEDFSRQTGVPFKASPVTFENIRTLLDSDQKTVDAWRAWACPKRHDFLVWLLKQVRGHRPDLFLFINQTWYQNWYMTAFYGPSDWVSFDKAKLNALGITDFNEFLKLIAYDAALYQDDDGICLAMEGERVLPTAQNRQFLWPSPYKTEWFAKLLAGFGGGVAISRPQHDESTKPLVGWNCQYVKDRRDFRRGMIEALLYANAREFFQDTYTMDAFRGRLDDIRQFSVPFLLLPFAKPTEFKGKISDTAKQAVIKQYGGRLGLMNPGDQPTEVTLTAPGRLYDLSNGVRQELLPGTTIHMEPWSLRTLEAE